MSFKTMFSAKYWLLGFRVKLEDLFHHLSFKWELAIQLRVQGEYELFLRASYRQESAPDNVSLAL